MVGLAPSTRPSPNSISTHQTRSVDAEEAVYSIETKAVTGGGFGVQLCPSLKCAEL
jgi:hypothetical protein